MIFNTFFETNAETSPETRRKRPQWAPAPPHFLCVDPEGLGRTQPPQLRHCPGLRHWRAHSFPPGQCQRQHRQHRPHRAQRHQTEAVSPALPSLAEDTPKPSAMMKGTVIAWWSHRGVKGHRQKILGAKAARAASPCRTRSAGRSRDLEQDRSSATTRKIPTPHGHRPIRRRWGSRHLPRQNLEDPARK